MMERFSDFMARALYDPERGYYTRRIRDIGGSRGDFATSATVSGRLGSAIAAWLRAESSATHVIEIGAGNGALMQQVRQELGWWRRLNWRFHIVEKSLVLQERQRQRLGSKVNWWASVAAALDDCNGRAMIYSNELIDAFPCTVAVWDATQKCWLESWIDEGREVLRPLDMSEFEAASFSALRDWPTPPQDGQRIELHATALDWLTTWAPHWKSGSILTIDYGDTFPALYHRRKGGTLRAYLLHQRLIGPEVWQNPGRQDITADVNFTDLRAWSSLLGWAEKSYTSQREFLQQWAPHHHADPQLAMPGGADDAFQCLIAQKS